jgi:hypothetical protein
MRLSALARRSMIWKCWSTVRESMCNKLPIAGDDSPLLPSKRISICLRVRCALPGGHSHARVLLRDMINSGRTKKRLDALPSKMTLTKRTSRKADRQHQTDAGQLLDHSVAGQRAAMPLRQHGDLSGELLGDPAQQARLADVGLRGPQPFQPPREPPAPKM